MPVPSIFPTWRMPSVMYLYSGVSGAYTTISHLRQRQRPLRDNKRLHRRGAHLAPPQALLEIETYTYENLPPKLRQGGVIESIAREFAWLGGKL